MLSKSSLIDNYLYFDISDAGQPILRYLSDYYFEVCVGIAKAEKQLFISKGSQDEEELRLLTYNENMWLDKRVTGQRHQILDTLNVGQLKEFFRAYKSHYFNSYFIPLRTPNGKYNFTTCFDGDSQWTNNIEYFPYLKEIIDQLPFNILGRVFLIYSPPASQEILHIDYWPKDKGNFYDGKRHFMWASTNKLLKIDKSIIQSHCCMFNFELPHSLVSSEQATVSIRIEGQFSKEYCLQKNILWKSR